MNRVVIEPDAQLDVRNAVQFYESRRQGLGKRFRASLRDAVRTIREHPEAWPEIEPGVRCTMLRGFPYKLYYLPQEMPISIIAVMHAVRNPDTWQSRRPR